MSAFEVAKASILEEVRKYEPPYMRNINLAAQMKDEDRARQAMIEAFKMHREMLDAAHAGEWGKALLKAHIVLLLVDQESLDKRDEPALKGLSMKMKQRLGKNRIIIEREMETYEDNLRNSLTEE